MKVTGYTTVICLVMVGVLECANAAPAPKPVYMTSQIQRLLNEKQEKISKLEECDGKRKGFMIAGISTLGLTAVGVGVNIAQASKSNKLSNQIADQNLELEKQQNNLAIINSQISEKQNNQARSECESQEGKIYVNGQCLDRERYECDQNPDKEWKDGKCVDKEEPQQPQNPQDYDGKFGEPCGEGKVWFSTVGATKKCLGTLGIVPCECIPAERYDGTIGQPCSSTEPDSVWTAGGDKKCLVAEGSKESVACSCKKQDVVPTNPVVTPTDPVVTPTDPVVTPTDPVVTPPKPVELPDRIIDKPCKTGDLPAHATEGKYSLNGALTCLKAEGSTDVVACNCKITKCDTARGYELKNGKCQAQEKLTCDPAKHLVCENAACTGCICEDTYVKLLHGDGNCVKRDYLKTEKCTCQDGTKACSLVSDPSGTLVCQTSKGWGEKCKCESCPRNYIYNSRSGKCEMDPVEKAKKNPDITCCDTTDIYSKYSGTWVFSGTLYANPKCQCIFEYKNVNASNAKNLIDAWGKANGESRFTCSPTDHNGRRAPQGQQARQCYGADTNAFYEFIFKK